MELFFVYAGIFIGIIALYFKQPAWLLPYKKPLVLTHFFLFAILAGLIISGLSLRGRFTEQIISLCFFLSGAFSFVLYRKRLWLLLRIYFGFFFFYPIAVIISSLINLTMGYVFGILITKPLLVPEKISSSGKSFDIRSNVGVFLGPKQVILIEKGSLFEKELGSSSDELWFNHPPKTFSVISQTQDSTVIQVVVNNKLENLTFHK